MKNKLTALVLAAGLVQAVVQAPTARAAARVFVSVNGTDAGDCSNVLAPCRTLAFAVAAVDVGGEVIVIDTGSYGPTTITKSVKINVPSGVVAFLAGTMTVNASTTDIVVLRGLTIKALTPGSGTGVVLQQAGALHIENCVIDGFSLGIDITATNGPRLYVTDSVVRSNFEGLNDQHPSGTAPTMSLARSRFLDNSDCGVLSSGSLVARDTDFSGNNGAVCALAGQANLENVNLTHNGCCGVLTFSGSTARVARSIVTGNGIGFDNLGGTIETLSNSLVRGNGTNTSGAITPVTGN